MALWLRESGIGPPIGQALTLGHLFMLAYAVALIACAWAAARHVRRRGPRFVTAVAAPWAMLFALLPNVRTRYLVWGPV